MIPKNIYTCWFSENGFIPESIQKCINSQKIDGYTHTLITIDNVIKDHPYIAQCLNSPHKTKKWVKLKDFIQYYYLYHLGGWFLDADMEILEGKNFDQFYHDDFVIGIEGSGSIKNSIILGSAVIGAAKKNSILRKTIDEMATRFRGDDDKCYESSLDILTRICIEDQDKVKFTDPEVFYPYNHDNGVTNITDNTIGIHKFTKSWILPTISIIIPHLDTKDGKRQKGLEDCIESIKNSTYPATLIEILVVKGDETVPEKIKRGVEKTTGDYIVFAANDMTFEPYALKNAVEASIKNSKALVSFNEGAVFPDKGNICTHFIIKRDFIPFIGGEIFSTELTHVGVDNLLWAKASKQDQAMWCESAKISHKHFSKVYQFDEVYSKGWINASEDRKKLEDLLTKV